MLTKINGRLKSFDHLENFSKVSRSTYVVYRNGIKYRIEGGKHAGGTKREWFVDSAEWTKAIFCTSLVDALTMLDRM